MQPGQTFTPGDTPDTPTWQFSPDSTSQPQSQQVSNQPPAVQPTEPAQPVPSSETVSWTASEFIAHAKSGSWYGLLIIATIAVAALVFLLTKDKISTAVIVIVAIIFGVAAARKPRELQYQIDEQGVRIADKTYLYSGFRSFAVVQEDNIESIWFMPLKRFMPIISIYFDPKDGEKIVDIISQYLPVENRQPDPVDRLMHRIRF